MIAHCTPELIANHLIVHFPNLGTVAPLSSPSRTVPAPVFCRSQGMMAGFDQKSNVVLSESKERVYSMEDGVEEIPLGLYLVKGDQMYVLLS